MEGVPLKKLKTFNNEKLCIICQKNTSDKTCSTENGRSQFIDAANIKQDEVHQRLQNLTRTFIYHMNYKCYKKYVHNQKTALAESPGSTAISCESEVSIENSFPSNSTTKCDLQDINDVLGADLYCHKNCINSYILKHVRALKKLNSQDEFPTVSKKEVVFGNLVSEIDTDLRKGIWYPLSDIRDQCNQLLGTVDQTVFTNEELKVLLINHYGKNVSISSSHNRSKSFLVFLCNISKEDIVETGHFAEGKRSCKGQIL